VKFSRSQAVGEDEFIDRRKLELQPRGGKQVSFQPRVAVLGLVEAGAVQQADERCDLSQVASTFDG